MRTDRLSVKILALLLSLLTLLPLASCGVTAPDEIQGAPKLQEAFELGAKVGED